jgi:hypothetical protein
VVLCEIVTTLYRCMLVLENLSERKCPMIAH